MTSVRTACPRLAGIALWVVATAAQAAPLDPPAPEAVEEARMLVAKMRDDPRGPYARIRWFCNDGSVQPPVANACAERGGGRQHGEYSADRARLAALGYRVGTVLAALSFDDLFDEGGRNDRLRELALERYLRDVDDGWVMRRARDYRGHVQVEGEMSAGRALLLKLYADTDWVAANYLLAREADRMLPHGEDSDLSRRVRRVSQDLAALEPATEPLRVEVHTAPSDATATKYRAWAASASGESRATALQLAADLDGLFGSAGRRARIEVGVAQAAHLHRDDALVASVLAALHAHGAARIGALADALAACRELIEAPTASPEARLTTFDLLTDLETELLVAGVAASEAPSRRVLAARALAYVEASYGVGLTSAGERAALTAAYRSLPSEVSLDAYRRFVRYLGQVPQWSAGTVRFTFAEPLVRYAALDPRAVRFVDDLLRSSPLGPLAAITRVLNADVQRLTGVGVEMFGEAPVGVFGLNAGYAAGQLVVYATPEALAEAPPDRDAVVVIPETTAELSPVAGILTLGEGNPLSHVQLLARNFAIPNVAVSPLVLEQLETHAGERVLLAVSRAGSVLLAAESQATALIEELQGGAQGALTGPATLTVPVPDLSVRRPLEIEALDKSLSGRVVGPKAANLGELNRLFPGRVAPALALPFGVFAEHTVAAREQLKAAYDAARGGTLDADGLARRLAEARTQIAQTTLSPEARRLLEDAMQRQFGDPGTYGVFVRSDTNVEDLPQFTGAGLSETVPNVVGLEAQLAAIPRVWSSVLSPRAIAWRSNLMSNPEHVYASTLIMKSVPATKSGVLVTANLIDAGAPGVTVATAWGVGGAVAGEVAETWVLGAAGAEMLVSEAKAPYRRGLAPAGGIEWLPATAGPVLTGREKTALRALAREALERYAPVPDEAGSPRPWDIEFGFVDGELTLFQIRPLVERGTQRVDRIIEARLEPTVTPVAEVALDAVPEPAA